MPDKRLVFPCSAYYPLNEWPVDGVHYAKDGAIRLCVHPGTKPALTPEVLALVKKRSGIDYDDRAAPCQYFCPTAKRRKEQRGYDEQGRLGTYVFCHARLYEDGVDITPPAPAKCPHCEEQRTYVQACKRAAKYKEPCPDREEWRLCPQCGEYKETSADTGLCAICRLCKVLR